MGRLSSLFCEFTMGGNKNTFCHTEAGVRWENRDAATVSAPPRRACAKQIKPNHPAVSPQTVDAGRRDGNLLDVNANAAQQKRVHLATKSELDNKVGFCVCVRRSRSLNRLTVLSELSSTVSGGESQ